MTVTAVPSRTGGYVPRAPGTPRTDWQRRIRVARPRRWAARRARVSVVAAARPRLVVTPPARQLTAARGARLPVGDLLAVGATLGAVVLWGLALTLLTP